jgi:hypothetical protein
VKVARDPITLRQQRLVAFSKALGDLARTQPE